MTFPAATLLAALLAALPAAAAADAGGEQAPWYGTWQLDPEASTSRAAPSPYKRVTLRIEPAADGLRVVYEMVGTRGGITHREWTGRFDGQDYAVQGVDYVLTNAYRRRDDRSYEIAIKVDGQPAATAIASVSPDGNTLIVDTVERDPSGRLANTRVVYARQ